MAKLRSTKRFLRPTFMVVVAVATIVGVFRLTTAGSLEPVAAPAGTLRDLGDIYDAIASTGFDSSSITANPNGSAFQVAKCIIARMTGGSCP